jgi:hypothetical protein
MLRVRWLARGAWDGLLGKLEAVQAAQADAEASLVARMTLAAQRGSWRAAAWLLERKYPERWGERVGLSEAGRARR